MPKIIHVAGTMGSGKTTLIRTLMSMGECTPQYEDWRKKPVGYLLSGVQSSCPVFIAGAYDVGIASGCDTIKNIALAYDLIRRWFGSGHTIVYEGLFMMNHTRGIDLQRDTKSLVVLRLTTPVDVCRQGVVDRRAAQGVEKVLSPNFNKELIGTNTRAKNYCNKVRWNGATVLPVTRDEALDVLVAQLKGD